MFFQVSAFSTETKRAYDSPTRN